MKALCAAAASHTTAVCTHSIAMQQIHCHSTTCQPAAEPAHSIINHITTILMKSVQRRHSQFCIPDAVEASAGAASGLGNLTGPPGDAGLEVVVVTQVPLGAFQCTGTGPDSAEVIPAAHMACLLNCNRHSQPTCLVMVRIATIALQSRLGKRSLNKVLK